MDSTTKQDSTKTRYCYGKKYSGSTENATSDTLKNNINLVLTANTSNIAKTIKLNSVRIYNRALTADEIEQNYLIDKIRFQNPVPTVKIAGNECANVVVLTSAKIQCTAPPNVDIGKKDVTVKTGNTTKTITNGYEYASPNSFFLIDVTPNVGPTFGGTPMTLTANKANAITSVTVGGEVCVTPREGYINDVTTYTCSIPVLTSGGDKNIVITSNVEGVILAQTYINAFTYVEATRDPVRFNVSSAP
jgi:hypothetical protein